MSAKKSQKMDIPKVALAILALLILSIAVALVRNQPGGLLSKEDPNYGNYQKVDAGSALHLSFPKEMNKEDVQANIESSEPLEGELAWQGNTMILQPDKRLEEGKTYWLRVGGEAKYASGEPINKEMEFRFVVSGPPVLSSHFPEEGAEDIAANTPIRLVFDRPMVPLTAVQGSGSDPYPEWPVSIEPPMSGSWRWLGTSAVEFRPDKDMELATSYTVRVPKGLTSVIGDKTQEDFSWSFNTQRPKLVSSDPSQENGLGNPAGPFFLTFDQEIGLRSAESEIKLMAVGESFKTTAAYGDDKKTIIIRPESPLEKVASYSIVSGSGLKPLKGDLESDRSYVINFRTAGDMRVIETKKEGWGAITINFSNPVENESLEGAVSMEPKPDGWEKMSLETNSWENHTQLSFYPPNLEPSTKYTLTVSKAVRDKFGQSMTEPHQFTFTTPPLDPSVSIVSKGDFGIFEAGRSPHYPIDAVNVSQVDIEMARIPFNEFLNIQKQKKTNWDHQPNLAGQIGLKRTSLKAENKLNEWETLFLDIDETNERRPVPGIYGVRVSAPEYKDSEGNPIIRYQYFALTNTALTLKFSGTKALVWAVDMRTGNPAKDVSLNFYNLNGQSVIQGRTDEQGFFETGIDLSEFKTTNNEWEPTFWVTGTNGAGDFTFVGSDWDRSIEPWNFGINQEFRGPLNKDLVDFHLYTERQIYRPGDSVSFKAILRLRDKAGVSRIPGQGIRALVIVEDAKYNEIFQKTVDLNEFGSLNGSFPIAEGAPLGNYRIRIELMPDDTVDNNYISHSFAVQEYRKPEYQVEVTPKQSDYFAGDRITFDITGSYYFGAPMNGSEVRWWAKTADYWFNRYTDGWYSFALEDSWCWWDCAAEEETVTEGDGNLDGNGRLSVSFPLEMSDKPVSQIVTLEADITDENNQVVSSRESVPVHKSSIYVGIASDDYVVLPGEKARMRIISLDPQGNPVSNQKVTLKLYSREWNSIRKKSVDGEYYYENEPKDTFVRDTTVSTEKDGKAVGEILVDEGGQYRVVAETSDSQGRESKAGTSLYAFSSTHINWSRSNDDRVEIIADKPEYTIGDTAKLLVKSPWQGEGVKAMVTVEREEVMSKQLIEIESNAQPVEILITEDMIPNAYVSVVIIKPRQGETFDDNGKDIGVPAFKVGYTKLRVETERKRMDLSITPDKEKYGPGETVTVNLKATDYKGAPLQAELSLGVVDLSVQALLGFRMPDLIQSFYDQRGLGVKTAEMLTYLIEVFKPGSKGGGGGDPELRERSDFKDTAYWNPNIVTDANGEATVSFTLPDNLTTWQLLAVGHTKGNIYGAAVREVIETKKVILRPVRPRFAVVGDEAKLGAIVHNFTDSQRRFRVSLAGEGFEGGGDQNILLDPEESKKVEFPITVLDTETLSLHFKAEAEGAPAALDEITESIPIYPFGTPQYVATSGVITEESALEKVFIPSEKEAKEGTLSLMVSPTLASYIPNGLEYLINFPYGCAEQIVSMFMPNIALKNLIGLGAIEGMDEDTLEKNILSGLGKLYTYQRADGGFGYFAGSDRSYPYLTAYITHALFTTRDGGYGVDANVISRARTYLSSVLRGQDMEDRVSLANRAYILYVLGEIGGRDVNLLNNLYEKRDQLPIFAKAYLAMGYGQSNDKAHTILSEIRNQVKLDSRGAHFEELNEPLWRLSMNTNTRTTALVLQLITRLTPSDTDLAPKIVRHLLAVREQGHWDTTQSTVATLLSLAEYMEATQELKGNFTADVSIGGQSVLKESFSDENILTREEVMKAFDEMKRGETTTITLNKAGEGRLYYDLAMDYFLTLDELPAADQGIGVRKEIMTLGKDGFTMRGPLKTNETYKVKLTITVPEDRHFVAVSSPLPAGMEGINFGLATSQQRLEDEVSQVEHFSHTEFRDDAVFLFADYLPAGVYEYEFLARATLPGKFLTRPTKAWEMYFPETFGQTEGGWTEIKE